MTLSLFYVTLGVTLSSLLSATWAQASENPSTTPTIILNSSPEITYSPGICTNADLSECLGAWWNTQLEDGSTIRTSVGPTPNYRNAPTNFTFTFLGTGFDLMGMQDRRGSNVLVQLDGFDTSFDTLNTTVSLQRYRITFARNLSATTVHTLTVSWLGGRLNSYLNFDRLLVYDYQPAPAASYGPETSSLSPIPSNPPASSSWDSEPSTQDMSQKRGTSPGLVAGLATSALAACLLATFLIARCMRRHNRIMARQRQTALSVVIPDLEPYIPTARSPAPPSLSSATSIAGDTLRRAGASKAREAGAARATPGLREMETFRDSNVWQVHLSQFTPPPAYAAHLQEDSTALDRDFETGCAVSTQPPTDSHTTGSGSVFLMGSTSKAPEKGMTITRQSSSLDPSSLVGRSPVTSQPKIEVPELDEIRERAERSLQSPPRLRVRTMEPFSVPLRRSVWFSSAASSHAEASTSTTYPIHEVTDFPAPPPAISNSAAAAAENAARSRSDSPTSSHSSGRYSGRSKRSGVRRELSPPASLRRNNVPVPVPPVPPPTPNPASVRAEVDASGFRRPHAYAVVSSPTETRLASAWV